MQIVNGKKVFTTLQELTEPKHTALLLIDIQNDYISPGGVWAKTGEKFELGQFVPNVKRVLDSARRNGVMVVFMQFTTHPNFIEESPASLRGRLLRAGDQNGKHGDLTSYCIEGTWGWQMIDKLTPLPGEFVLKKHRLSSFYGTSLDIILSSNGIKSIVIAGLVTHGCVLATVLDAQPMGYYPVLLRDCIVSHKPQLHDAALFLMSESKDVIGSKELLAVWGD